MADAHFPIINPLTRMHSSLPVVLGIVPGSRQIGVSVFIGEELIFFGIKTIKAENKSKTVTKMRRIIQDLINEYEITYVALKKIAFIQQHRSFVKVVVEELNDFLAKQKISFFAYDPKTVRKLLCENENPTKQNTALILARRYSELSGYTKVEKIWQKRYFSQMQDAVAIGLVCTKELVKLHSF